MPLVDLTSRTPLCIEISKVSPQVVNYDDSRFVAIQTIIRGGNSVLVDDIEDFQTVDSTRVLDSLTPSIIKVG